MKVVVDTNILFSALLNTNSRTGRILFNSQKRSSFFTCEFLKVEISRHEEKLLNIPEMSSKAFHIAKSNVFDKPKFVDHELISPNTWKNARQLVADIDPDDVSFVALTIDLKNSY